MKKLIPLFSRKSRNLSAMRLVVLLMFAAAILFIVGSPKIIQSAGPEKSESFAVTPFVGPLTLTVNTLGDAADTNVGDGLCDTDTGTAGDQCTLRAAIQETNFVSSNDTINFNLPPNSTIILNTALSFSGNITVVGPGANLLTIQRSTAPGTPNFSIFTFIPINGNFNDSISGLTIANGVNTAPISGGGTSGLGGCVVNLSPDVLTLTDTIFSGCSAQNGGAIYNSGTATLTNSKVNNNNAVNGGGIYNAGTLTLTNSTVKNNQTASGDPNGGSGGGIFTQSGTATLTNSIISGNKTGDGSSASAHGGDGGGISAMGTLTLTDSTVSGNTTGNGGAGAPGGYGGGIYSIATLTINNSTISGNQTGSGSTTGAGGGIMNGGSAALTNSTVSGNQIGAANQGGGIFNYGTLTLTNGTVSNNSSGNSSSGSGIFNSGTTNLKDTIVANNTVNGVGNDLSGTFNSQDYNLIEAPAAATISGTTTHNIVGQDPNLGPLANNGGPTQTQALLAGSAAIDAGDTSQTMDQRGQPRPIDDATAANAAGGNAADIGAYEAHNYEVNSTADVSDGACTALTTGNGCTLREAIAAANTDVGAESITFAPALTASGPATVTLSTALPEIATSMSISGSGANLLTVIRNSAGGTPSFRIFNIQSGTVNISGLTISGGSPTVGNYGGGISNSGTLSLTNTTISGNTVPFSTLGGGIYNNGTLMLTNSAVANNSSSGGGGCGGIYNQGTLTLTNSTVSGNTATGGGGSGGGICNLGPLLILTNSVVSDNSAMFGFGGGIENSSSSPVTLINSTVSGNTAHIGGGIGHNGTLLTLINSTVSGNSVTGSGNAAGGIFTSGPSTLTLTNSTVSNNSTSSGPGGGIRNNSATVNLGNTIIANNTVGAGGTGPDLSGPFTSQDYNLIGSTADATINGTTTHNIINTSANLSALANNGGPTWTHALLPGSPAINAGSNANLPADTFDLDGDGNTAEPVPFDQRGITRVTNTTVDIGAFESRGFTIAATGGAGQITSILTAFALPLKATVSSAFSEPVAGGVVTFVTPSNASGPSASFPGSLETASATIDNSGVATSPTLTANTSAGSYNVIAGLGAGSPTAGFVLSNKASTFTQLTSSVNPSNVGQSVTYTATVSTAGGTPTGTVQFKDGGTQLGSPQALDSSFPPKATLSTIPLNAGTHTITAEYSGDTNFFSSSSLSIDQVVNLSPTSTGVNSSVNPSDFGQNVTFTATVTSSPGTPTGTVQFKDGGSSLGAPQTLNQSGVTTFSTSALTAGSHTITADYSGDNSFAASTGTLSGGQVVKAPSLSINDATITEGDSGTKSLNFTVTLSATSSQTVTVSYATGNNGADAPSDYTAIPTTILTFNPGDTTHTIPVTVNGDQSVELNETFFVILSNSTNATISDGLGVGTILDDDTPGGSISFAQANYIVGESAGLLTITVNRTGNTSGAATVGYATDDGVQPGLPCSSTNGMASSRCDYTTAMGRLNFAAGETQKTLNVLVNRDSYAEGPESFIVFLLSIPGGGVVTSPAGAVVTIADDSSGLPPNAIDDAQFFVLQHYHDFLNRQPDNSGLNFWTNQITSCGTDQQCIELRRINVSAAFFLSIEFQETGYLVERLYKAAYGDADQTSTFGGSHQFKAPIIRLPEFLPDTQEIGLGVVVSEPGWETVLENNKRAFTAKFVQRARFTGAFPPLMTAAQFVDTLNTNAGKPLSVSERNQLVADLSSNNKTRADVLRAVAEDPDLIASESNRAFVLMQFFGYLRRNSNEQPDSDYTGYDFWLTKLNQFNGNFVNAEMVKAFITSGEYRQRFGP